MNNLDTPTTLTLTDPANANVRVKYNTELKQWYIIKDDINWIGLSRSIKYGQTALTYARSYFNSFNKSS